MKKEQLIKISIKEKIKSGIFSASNIFGVDQGYVKRRSINGATILMYHSIGDERNRQWIDPRNQLPLETFKRHMKFLSKNRNVISMGTLIESIREKKDLPCGSVVVTLDDGYYDNFTLAAPILQKYNVPALIYLATGYIARGEPQWIDRLYSSFSNRTCSDSGITIPELDINIEKTKKEYIWSIYKKISSRLIPLSYEKRVEIIEQIEYLFMPSGKMPKLTMEWSDVRQMIKQFPIVELGSHTLNHLDLSSLKADEIQREISLSTDAIKGETGVTPIHFSCPYSRSNDSLESILVSNGYVSNVMNNQNLLITKDNLPFELGRIKAPDNRHCLAHFTSGAYPDLSKKILKGRY